MGARADPAGTGAPVTMKPKRPRDANQLAKFIVDRSVGEIADPDPLEGKNRSAVERGRVGGLRGGKARATALSARRRKAIAKKAANARWGKPLSSCCTTFYNNHNT